MPVITGSGLTDPVEEATGASLEGETPTVAPVVGTLQETERMRHEKAFIRIEFCREHYCYP